MAATVDKAECVDSPRQNRQTRSRLIPTVWTKVVTVSLAPVPFLSVRYPEPRGTDGQWKGRRWSRNFEMHGWAVDTVFSIDRS